MLREKLRELIGPSMAELQGEALEINDIYNRAHEAGRQSAQRDNNGLLNNEGYRQSLDQTAEQALEEGASLFNIIMDEDALKAVNDAHGHYVGDILIDETGADLKEIVGLFDFVEDAARIGGDEFAIYGKGGEIEALEVIKEIIRRHDERVNKPGSEAIKAEGFDLSIGFAVSGGDIKSGTDLMGKADDEMYKQKIAKLDRLSRMQSMGILAVHLMLKMSNIPRSDAAKILRKRDAPKLWRRMGIID